MLLRTAFLALLPAAVFAGKGPLVSNIYLDFDGTIAVTEAFQTLADAAYATIPANSTYPSWNDFLANYTQIYGAFVAAFGPRNNLSREIQFQSSLEERAIEVSNFDIVAASGVFNQTQYGNLVTQAKTVQLRAGFWELIKDAFSRGIQPAVISLNWSPSWIRLVLRVNADTEWKQVLAEHVPIYCSEILPAGLIPPNPLNFPTRLHTGGDKVALIKQLVQKWPLKSGVIFVGDSKADFPPLVLSPTTIGIVAAGTSSMDAALTQFVIEVKAANASDVLQTTTGTNSLWRLESFADIVGKFRGPFDTV